MVSMLNNYEHEKWLINGPAHVDLMFIKKWHYARQAVAVHISTVKSKPVLCIMRSYYTRYKFSKMLSKEKAVHTFYHYTNIYIVDYL